MFHVPEKFRLKKPHSLGSDESYGNNGAFVIRLGKLRCFCIASDGMGWEHVSVSKRNQCPTWDEMCAVKDLFWDAEDCVVQYHPPKSEYVNNHPYCLHLWRPTEQTIPMPPSLTVGVKDSDAGA